ncbi:class I SAM-dependent methyltransferase [Candidatus Berkelbacteria bacterium]|nr:class I SAM-dependent methyltransferase [Candidatus Berkelbacteria bacterium]
MKRSPFAALLLSHWLRRMRLQLLRPQPEPMADQPIEQLRQGFEALYESMEDPWDYRRTAYERRRRAELVLLIPEFVDTILEIGCGEGWLTDWLKAKELMSKVYGVDMSDIAVSRAVEQYPLITFRTLAFGRDPLPRDFPKKFDVIVAADVLYYGDKLQREQMIREIIRLLTPDGRLIVSLSPRHNQTEIKRLKKYFMVEEEKTIGHLSWLARLRPKRTRLRATRTQP